jgi:hypothetical protein
MPDELAKALQCAFWIVSILWIFRQWIDKNRKGK